MANNRDGGIVKKWRADEYIHHATLTRIGIYVNPVSGNWYARIPEVEEGVLVVEKTKDLLMPKVRREAERILTLDWKPFVRVSLGHPERREDLSLYSHTTQRNRWDPGNPNTAGDIVSLHTQRVEIAVDNTGARLEREWRETLPEGHPCRGPDGFDVDDQRKAYPARFTTEPGVSAELPLTPELWEALQTFRGKIRVLNHMLRHLISQPDFEQRLLALPTTPLLPVSPDGS